MLAVSIPYRPISVLAALALGGCVAVENVAPPATPQMAASAGVNFSKLESGRRLYTGRCASCHSIDPVTKYSPGRWREIIEDMADEAELTPIEKDNVLSYVLAARSVATAAARP